ncbi:MAG: hypothetical protein HN509_16635 [Halobacteriovoraceae bacterium]|nr:hypothetical protein [Halobacteriovoraceae bacterium]
MSNILKSEGHFVSLAENCEDAIELLKDEEFNLAFLDIVLGENKSSDAIVDFLYHEKGHPNSNTPLVIMSAHMQDRYEAKIKLKGPTIYMTLKKPLTKESILNSLGGVPNRNVLIVDDDLDILSLIKLDLLGKGFTVFTAPGVAEAKKLLAEIDFLVGIFDIVLSDGNTSHEFINYLDNPEAFKNKNLPLIITSAHMDEEYAETIKLKKENIIGAIKKPFPPKAFSDLIKSYFNPPKKKTKVTSILQGITQNSDNTSSLVKGQKNGTEAISKISGGKESPDENTLVNGNKDTSEIESTKIDGTTDNIEEEKFTIKGERKDDFVNQQKWKIKELDSEISEIENMAKEDINARNSRGMTALMIYSLAGQMDTVKSIIESGGKASLKSKDGKSPIHYATMSGSLETVKLLLWEGSRTSARDSANKDPLFYAVVNGHADITETLIEYGGRIDGKIDGKSYLMLSAEHEHLEVFEVLIKAGANPKLKDFDGHSVSEIIEKKHLLKFAQILKK